MKPIKNFIDVNNQTLGYISQNVCMEIERDEKDIAISTGVYNFDILMKALNDIKKEFPALKPETRNYKPDRRYIEISLMTHPIAPKNAPCLQFRVLSRDTKKMVPEGKQRRIAMAPIILENKETFEDTQPRGDQ